MERPIAQLGGQGEVHPAVKKEAEIREMEGGVALQRDYEHRETEFDIPLQQSEGCQLGATLPKGMMSEPVYTAGPSSQPSFIESPHTQTSPHQAPYSLGQAS